VNPSTSLRSFVLFRSLPVPEAGLPWPWATGRFSLSGWAILWRLVLLVPGPAPDQQAGGFATCLLQAVLPHFFQWNPCSVRVRCRAFLQPGVDGTASALRRADQDNSDQGGQRSLRLTCLEEGTFAASDPAAAQAHELDLIIELAERARMPDVPRRATGEAGTGPLLPCFAPAHELTTDAGGMR
jgi:hypothetical protein